MNLKLHGNVEGRYSAKMLGCGLALLLLTGCAGSPVLGQTGNEELLDTGLSADVSPTTLPAPVGTAGNPDTQPIAPGVSPDTQPARVPGIMFNQVKCGTATMDVPASFDVVSEYGESDKTTEYASADGKTKLELNCRDRKASDSPNTDFQNAKNASTYPPNYTYNKNNKWVITGPGLLCAGQCAGADSSEYYKATWYSNSKVFSMLWEYPASDHVTISPTIDHVYHSFKWNGGTAAPVAPGQTQQPAPVAPVAPGQTQQPAPVAPVAPGQTQQPAPVQPVTPGQTQQPAPVQPQGPSAKTTMKLALREGPECSAARLSWIPKGESVGVERAAVGSEEGWYLVSYEGQMGWASGYYLDGDTITYAGPKLCEN